MRDVEYVQVDPGTHRALLLELNLEYLNQVVREIQECYDMDATEAAGQSVREYAQMSVDQLLEFRPPNGIFYLLEVHGELAGMGGIQKMRKGVGQIKRMYVRPEFRRKGLGRAMLRSLEDKAREFGFSSIMLDTGKFSHAAQQLYRSEGYSEIPEYPETEAPPELRRFWMFMRKDL